MKITYAITIEVPDNATLAEADAFKASLNQVLTWNQDKDWKTSLRRVVGVQEQDGPRRP